MAGNLPQDHTLDEEFDAPPSKKPRLDHPPLDSPAPGTPFDDMDDIYGTPAAQPIAMPDPAQSSGDLAAEGTNGPSKVDSPAEGIPGLGMLGPSPLKQEPQEQSVEEHSVEGHSVETAQMQSAEEPQEPEAVGKESEDKKIHDAESEVLMEDAPVSGSSSHPPAALVSGETVAKAEESDTKDDEKVETDPLAVTPTLPERSIAPGPAAELPPPLAPSDVAEAELALAGSSFLEAGPSAEEAGPDAAPEWEVDSSAQDSSSSDDTESVDSDSSDDKSDDDYTLLSPEEQARILMQGDGGSDDEGGGNKGGKTGGVLRTKNEVTEDKVDRPDVVITPEMKLEELGAVEALVANLVLIKARTSGEYRVLEQGSVICSKDRTVLGVIAEPLGRVQQPRYAVRFNDQAEITEAELVVGTKIYYVDQFATYVFTQALRALKGSDASNLHDEEVNDDEIEFSDDEAEAEHKKRVKLERQARRGGRRGQDAGSARSGHHSMGRQRLDYDDPAAGQGNEQDDDGPYTPLARPTNYHELMGSREAPLEARSRAGFHDGRGRGGGSGDRGRGRGGRGMANDRGRGGRGGGGRGDRAERRGGRGRGGHDVRDNDLKREQHTMPPRPTHYEQHEGPPSFHSPSSHSSMAPRPGAYAPPPQYQPQPQLQQQPRLQQQPQQQQYPYSPSQPYPQQAAYGWPPQTSPQMPSPGAFPFLPPAQPNMSPYYQPQAAPVVSPGGGPPLPPGAFVNPAFFRNQQHYSPQPSPQQWSPHPTQGQFDSPMAGGPHVGQAASGQAASRMSPESDAAFRAAQEKLEILRGLTGGQNPPPQ